MDADSISNESKDKMEKALAALVRELGSVRAGKASASMLDNVRVDYYGSMVPVHQVASINVPEPKLLVVQPWERNMVSAISRAIQAASLGLNPTDDGVVVRIPIPSLTEERRKDLVKKVKHIGETSKVALRQVRREANDLVKKLQGEKKLSEDVAHRLNTDIQKLTDDYVKRVDDVLKKKEAEVLEI
jgi:ribosome recycling factor